MGGYSTARLALLPAPRSCGLLTPTPTAVDRGLSVVREAVRVALATDPLPNTSSIPLGRGACRKICSPEGRAAASYRLSGVWLPTLPAVQRQPKLAVPIRYLRET